LPQGEIANEVIGYRAQKRENLYFLIIYDISTKLALGENHIVAI